MLEALEAAVTRWSNIADNRERMDRDDAGAWAFRCAIEDVRAAGMRETGGKGQTPRDALLAAAARLTDMGISARAAELLTEWAGEA